MPEPGWYHDPAWSGRLRLWDGARWCDETRPLPPGAPRAATGALGEDRRSWLQGFAVVLVLVALLAMAVLPGRPAGGGLAFSDPPPPSTMNDLAVRQIGTTASSDASTTTVAAPAPAAAAAPAVAATPVASQPRPVPNLPTPALRVAPTSTSSPAPRPISSAPPMVLGLAAVDFSLTGFRWNPCQVIGVSSAGPDVHAVVAELAAITGLHLAVVDGPAQIDVSWGPSPVSNDIGVTYLTAVGATIIHATVTLENRARPYLATVLRHELGHALGLGHAPQPGAVMYAVLSSGAPVDYQAGDLAGLRAVSTPTPGC